MRVDSGSQELTTDVLVIGGGGSGLTAAVSAAEQGARVIVAEKCSHAGGTTGLSIGSITACCTSHQARNGISDSPEAMFEDVQKFNKEWDRYDNKELCWIAIREGANTIEWLESHGIKFVGPALEPPHRVPRMHNVIPNATSYPMLLQTAAAKKGVQFLFNTSGVRLIQAEGRITGAVLENRARNLSCRVTARRGVVLTCGDYSGSAALKQRYLPPGLAQVPASNPDCQGDGHIMGAEVGGHLVNMSVFKRPDIRFAPARKKLWHELLPSTPFLVKLYAAGSRFLPDSVFTRIAKGILTTRGAPDFGMFREGAILVNIRGERFTDELKNPHQALAEQPEHQGYIIFDSKFAGKFSRWPHFVSTAAGIAYAYVQDYENDVPEVISKRQTLREAAERIHPHPDALVRTVERYNGFVERQSDTDMGRSPLGEGISAPPFYVMGPVLAYIGITWGGLAIDSNFQVLNESGTVIPGLFSAGRNAGGLMMMGHGLGLAWALTSGRLAGKIVACSTPL